MIRVDFESNSRFTIKSRGHEVTCDQPVPTGDDSGMGPVELFLGALGGCAGFYAKQFMQTRNLDPAGLAVTVNAERSSGSSPRISAINIELVIPDSVPEKYHRPVQRAAETCFLFRSMPEPVEMRTTLTLAATKS